jgi:hypothetical protein
VQPHPSPAVSDSVKQGILNRVVLRLFCACAALVQLYALVEIKASESKRLKPLRRETLCLWAA